MSLELISVGDTGGAWSPFNGCCTAPRPDPSNADWQLDVILSYYIIGQCMSKMGDSPSFAVSNRKRDSERFVVLNVRHLRREKYGYSHVGQPTQFSTGVRLWHSRAKVNLKRHVVRKNGKQHIYYSLSETIRINKNRTVQRRVLNLGELNTTQTEQWQRSIEVIEAEDQSRQRRLFTDREGRAPADAADACEVILSSLSVRRPREFGACWLGSRLWQEL